jgi:hypothetical protein
VRSKNATNIMMKNIMDICEYCISYITSHIRYYFYIKTKLKLLEISKKLSENSHFQLRFPQVKVCNIFKSAVPSYLG